VNGSDVPELPEVETTRRCLEPDLASARIVDVDVRRNRMVRRQARPRDFADRLRGRRIRRLGRRGKFLMADLDGDITWVTHLGMSGRVAMASPDEPERPHTNVVVRTDRDQEFRLIDPRTFGFVVAWTPEELEASSLGSLGPDAYDALPRSRALHHVLEGRAAPIKSLLLDQHLLAGLGNIYADEALHRARIAPSRPGGSLTIDEVQRLRRAIRATLDAGLKWGGTSLDDLAYLLPDGRAGEYVHRLKVYGRSGELCRRCGTEIRRAVLRQRSTHWCPQCQI
jgi:formamidopyrimidine-DNA glycosylase